MQLRRVVELAGMTKYCDFAEQQAGPSGERPDMRVNLPEQRTIIIDSKASTAAYMEAQEEEDKARRPEIMTKHARAMKSQVDDLARKDYGSKDPSSLDFVVMFVPGDQFLAMAPEQDPGLVEYAMGKRVAISTPASLISLLWAVSNGWQKYRVAQDAQEIQALGEEMHKRLLTFMGHYQRAGKGLDDAVAAYNRSIGSFDRQVVPQGRRFAEMVRPDSEECSSPPALEQTARESQYALEPAETEDEPQNNPGPKETERQATAPPLQHTGNHRPPEDEDRWVRIDKFNGLGFETATRIRFPDGEEREIKFGKDVIIETATWLHRNGILKESQLPIRSGRKHNLAESAGKPVPTNPERYSNIPESNIRVHSDLSRERAVSKSVELIRRLEAETVGDEADARTLRKETNAGTHPGHAPKHSSPGNP